MDRRTFVKTVPALAMMAGASSAFAGVSARRRPSLVAAVPPWRRRR